MLHCNACGRGAVCGGAVRAVFLCCLLLASCGRRDEGVFTSPGGRCDAIVLSDPEGHSPLTTTRVAVRPRGAGTFREVRLPAPAERFSTYFDGWESGDVLLLHASTLDGDVRARYSCATGKVEVLR